METRNSLLTTRQAAEFLGLSPRTLECWRLTGAGPRYVKFAGLRGAVRYRLEDLEAWFASRTRTSTSEVRS